MIWLTLAVLSVLRNVDSTEFKPFFPHDSFFSAPAEDSFGFLPNYKLSSLDAPISLRPDFNAPFASESSDLPLYTDGKASLPQTTLSKLEKDYKAQLKRVANTNLETYVRNGKSYTFSGRTPSFSSEPFPSASNHNERDYIRSYSEGFKTEPLSRTVESASNHNERDYIRSYSEGFQREPLSKTVEIQTGFVPILGKRVQESTVLKELEPPILTASSVPTTPTIFKVSASVQSSSKIPTASDNSSSSAQQARSGTYSRKLDLGKDAKVLAVSSSSSESVITSIVPNEQQPRDFLRVNEEAKLSAKKTLEINCNGSRDLGWCELGAKYPRKYVDQIIASCEDVIQRMYIEVPHSFEKLSDISNFKSELDNSRSSVREAKERGSHDAWSWAAYFHQGSLCESEAGFLRPETAKDTSGKWNIILQSEVLKQRVPIEMCRKTNTSCKKSCGLKSSQCLQKYNYHLLLSVNPIQKHDCPSMKLYRFPSACVCHAD